MSTEGGRESGDMVNLIILLIMSHSYLDSIILILGSASSKRVEMSSMRSGGATPEIRQNYSGGRIVFNAIHA